MKYNIDTLMYFLNNLPPQYVIQLNMKKIMFELIT